MKIRTALVAAVLLAQLNSGRPYTVEQVLGFPSPENLVASPAGSINTALMAHALVGDGITDADLRQALNVQFESSPISAVPTWKSPVLLIHGEDDRIVEFKQSIDLRRRLGEKGVHVEELVLPDDIHDSLLWRN